MAEAFVTGLDLDDFVQRVLAEDLGIGGDVTSAATIPIDATIVAVLASREHVTIAGLPLAEMFFRALDADVKIERLVEDGSRVAPGAPVLRIAGNARKALAAERSALNTLQHLTGIATMTRKYVDRISGTGCTLLDTRKTVPGLRVLEKYATRMGGAENHRMRLDDGILIKDNHVAVCGGVAQAVRAAKESNFGLLIQVEVDSIDQIEPALSAGAERLLLDNMPPPVLRKAVDLIGGRVPTEASGGVRLETIREIAETGVTYVSVGRITQSAPAADLGMDYEISVED
ncbi:carboxylating nicotinate-nucleotide diphosphorylase [Sphingomonas sp. ID0503]|uniref:carboxylating nicotinate-nucleotide diphosphorylase n=1 Tax=Sphingomonas sp. ID0503 TaxID=3399691 RepID=UPI003AFA86BF